MTLAKSWGLSPREVRRLTNGEVAMMWQILTEIHEAEEQARKEAQRRG